MGPGEVPRNEYINDGAIYNPMSCIRRSIKVLIVLALIFLIAVPVALPYWSQVKAGPTSRQLIKDEWDVYGNEVVTNQTILLTGNLSIILTAQLTLKDSTLNINLTADKQYNILVQDGGKLVLNNTIIRVSKPGHRFRFDVINASMTADKSTVENFTSLSFIGSKAVLNTTSFLDNGGDSIIMADSNVKMSGCSVTVKGRGAALTVFQSTLDMSASTLRNLGQPANIGINHTWSSNITIHGGAIYNFSTGVLFHGDHLMMDRVNVSGSSENGVLMQGGSSEITNSSFSSDYYSINCDRATSANITFNDVFAQNTGIVVNLCKARVDDNIVTAGQTGIYVLGGPAEVGGNLLSDNKVGLQWSMSNNGSIIRNQFFGNDRGVVMVFSTMKIEECQFADKVTDIVSNGSAVTTIDSYFTKSIIEDPMGRILVDWTINVYVKSPSDNPVPDAKVELTDKFGKTTAGTTGADGIVHNLLLPERSDTRYANSSYTPYHVKVQNATAQYEAQVDVKGPGTLTITLIGLDLSITNLALSHSVIQVGSPIFINVTVECKAFPISGIGMDLYEDGNFYTSTYFNQSAETAVVSFRYIPGSAGSHVLKVRLDPTNSFKETNESNNEKSFNVTALGNGGGGGPLPDIRPLSVSTDTAGLATGNPIVISVQVENAGNADAYNVQVRLSIDGTNVGLKNISVIKAGESQTKTFSWTGTAGTHTIRVEVDPANLIQESNETNNVAEQKIDLSAANSALTQAVMIICVSILVITVVIVIIIIYVMSKRSRTPPRPQYQYQYGQAYPPQQGPNTPYFPGTYAPTQSPSYAPRTPAAPVPTEAPDLKKNKPPREQRAPDPERIPTGLCPRCGGNNIKYFDDGHRLCQDCRKIFF